MSALPRYIYTTQQIRELEHHCYQQHIASETLLMERAGQAAFYCLREQWPQAQNIHVFCGAGNNGGDGYVLARLAKQAQLQVTVWQVGDHRKLKNAAQDALITCQKAEVMIKHFDTEHFPDNGIIVDAIFGTGLNKPVTGEHAEAITKINASQLPVLAMDNPSGLQSDTGAALGHAVQANVTITFLGLKLGLLTGQGPAYCGKIHYADLALPAACFSILPPLAQRLENDLLSSQLLPRRRDAHKGDFGHVLVIGGDAGMPGAVRLAAESAARAGAGLISVATHPSHVSAIISPRPELMCHGITHASELEKLFTRATVIALGPGLGRSEWSKEIFACVMQSQLPMVVDADGLFWLSQFEIGRDNWVLTPHPGEAARLLQIEIAAIQQNRLAAVGMLQAQFGGTIVLKGAGTLILGESRLPRICTDGNPGMASGGMGDALTGIIAGLVAQKISLETAAHISVLIHAQAADIAARSDGERGLLATDLLPYVRRLVNP